MSELSKSNYSDVNDQARSAKKWMGYLLFIIFLTLVQLYRLEFQIHADQVDAVSKAKRIMFLILGVQIITSMACLDIFYKRKYGLAKIISIITALLGIAAIIIFVFIPESRRLFIK